MNIVKCHILSDAPVKYDLKGNLEYNAHATASCGKLYSFISCLDDIKVGDVCLAFVQHTIKVVIVREICEPISSSVLVGTLKPLVGRMDHGQFKYFLALRDEVARIKRTKEVFSEDPVLRLAELNLLEKALKRP